MNLRNLAITGMILLAMLAFYAFVSQGGAMSGAAAPGGSGRPEAVTYSQLLQQVEAGQVKEAAIMASTSWVLGVTVTEVKRRSSL